MRKLINQLLKFGIVGVICFGIDYGLMVFSTEILGIQYLVSCGISFTVSVVVNYRLSMRYVFYSKDEMSKHREFIIFIVLSVIGLGLTELLMWVFVAFGDIYYMFSKIIVTAIVMLYNFVTRKYFLEDHEKYNQA